MDAGWEEGRLEGLRPGSALGECGAGGGPGGRLGAAGGSWSGASTAETPRSFFYL